MKRLLFTLALFAFVPGLFAQELSCQIDINTQQVQGSTNKQIFDQMKRVVYEFMNNTKWTSESY